MPSRRRSAARRSFGLLSPGIIAAALALGACASEDTRDPAAFCDRIRTLQPALTDPNDPRALLALYEDLDDHAPLQIRDDWHQITVLLASVNTYDPADPAEVQAIQRAVLRSQAAVTAVAVWARDTCDIDLGPIPTTVPIGGTGDELISDQPTDTTDPSATDADTVSDTADTTSTG